MHKCACIYRNVYISMYVYNELKTYIYIQYTCIYTYIYIAPDSLPFTFHVHSCRVAAASIGLHFFYFYFLLFLFILFPIYIIYTFSRVRYTLVSHFNRLLIVHVCNYALKKKYYAMRTIILFIHILHFSMVAFN